jgi:regulatory protein
MPAVVPRARNRCSFDNECGTNMAMESSQSPVQRTARRSRREPRRPPQPLDAQRLEELALAYVARFATSAGRLASYCRRKLRERGHTGAADGLPPPDVDALVGRLVANGYVDDASYSRVKAGGLLRRGYGARRVDQALRTDAISEELRNAVAPGEADRREAAAAYARRRRLGPYARCGSTQADVRVREKQLAALVRAGHDLGHARRLLAARCPEEIEDWIAEALENQEDD